MGDQLRGKKFTSIISLTLRFRGDDSRRFEARAYFGFDWCAFFFALAGETVKIHETPPDETVLSESPIHRRGLAIFVVRVSSSRVADNNNRRRRSWATFLRDPVFSHIVRLLLHNKRGKPTTHFDVLRQL